MLINFRGLEDYTETPEVKGIVVEEQGRLVIINDLALLPRGNTLQVSVVAKKGKTYLKLFT